MGHVPGTSEQTVLDAWRESITLLVVVASSKPKQNPFLPLFDVLRIAVPVGDTIPVHVQRCGFLRVSHRDDVKDNGICELRYRIVLAGKREEQVQV